VLDKTTLFIVVHNLMRDDCIEERIAKIERAITRAVMSTSGFQITENDISFSFPSDPTITTARIAVVISVEMFFNNLERVSEIRQALAQNIGEAFRETITAWRNLRKVRVNVKSFDAEQYSTFSP
jgi:hypothetical protein